MHGYLLFTAGYLVGWFVRLTTSSYENTAFMEQRKYDGLKRAFTVLKRSGYVSLQLASSGFLANS